MLETARIKPTYVFIYYQDPRDPTTKLPITQPRGVFTTPSKLSQLPSSYLDGKFLMAVQGKEADPYVDPTKLKMGLVTAQGVSIAKGKKDKDGKTDERKPFYPAVNKWNTYTGKDMKDAAYKRIGAPFEYVDHKEGDRKKPLPKDEKGTLTPYFRQTICPRHAAQPSVGGDPSRPLRQHLWPHDKQLSSLQRAGLWSASEDRVCNSHLIVERKGKVEQDL